MRHHPHVVALVAAFALALGACSKGGTPAPSPAPEASKVNPADGPKAAPPADAPKIAPDPAKPADAPKPPPTDAPQPIEARPAEPPKPADAPTEAPKPVETKPAQGAPDPSQPMTKKAPPTLTPEEQAAQKAQRKAFWGLVNEGRGLVRKAKDYTGGIAKYLEALKIVPNHPSALGEIGYAYLLADNLDEAAHYTTLALAQQTSYRQRGMLHYNRGQILEKQGDPRGALNAYRSSWAARHNDTVKARIDELAAQVGKSPRKTFNALAAICDKVKADWPCGNGPDDAQCTCGTRFVGPAASGIARAAIVRVTGQGLGAVDAEYLVVEAKPDDWRFVGQVTNGWSPGAFGISNSGAIARVELAPLADGQGAALVLVADNLLTDSDMGTNALTEEGSTTLTLCTLDGDAVRCLEVPLGKVDNLTKLMDDGETPPEEGYGKLHEESWHLDATFDGKGQVTITVRDGEVPADLKDLVGTYPVADLANKPGVVVTEL